jgi:hypothetical protein
LTIQAETDRRLVDALEKSIDWVVLFRPNLAPHEKGHECRGKGDGKKRSTQHSKGLREGKRPKKPTFLALQGKDGQESDGYNDKGKEKGWTYLFRRVDDYFSSEFGVRTSE